MLVYTQKVYNLDSLSGVSYITVISFKVRKGCIYINSMCNVHRDIHNRCVCSLIYILNYKLIDVLYIY